MGADELVPVLEKVDLFHDLDQKLLRRIAEAGREESFGPGEVVLVEGEEVSGFRAFSPKGVEMHVVLTGSARASVDAAGDGRAAPGGGAPQVLTSAAYAGQNSRDQVLGPTLPRPAQPRCFWKRLTAALVEVP